MPRAPRAGVQTHPLPPEGIGESWYSVETHTYGKGMRDVFVNGDNVTHFTRPQHIYKARVSPDNRYLLVWHLDYAPRKLSVYDLQVSATVSSFEPGAGGHLQWAAGDVIYHQFGAGTNTAIVRVYDVSGNVIWEHDGSGAWLGGSGRYVFTGPTLPVSPEQIQVMDVRNGNVLASVRPADIATVLSQTWLDGQNVRFWYSDTEGHVKTVDIRVDPERGAPQRGAGM